MLTPTDQIDFPLMELTINDEMQQHSAANCVQLQNVANLRQVPPRCMQIIENRKLIVMRPTNLNLG